MIETYRVRASDTHEVWSRWMTPADMGQRPIPEIVALFNRGEDLAQITFSFPGGGSMEFQPEAVPSLKENT